MSNPSFLEEKRVVPIQIKTERRRWVVVKNGARLVCGPRQQYRWASIRKIQPNEVSSYESMHEAALALVRYTNQ